MIINNYNNTSELVLFSFHRTNFVNFIAFFILKSDKKNDVVAISKKVLYELT